jgi:hypothetical protein
VVEKPCVPQNQHPGIGSDEIAGPERQDYQKKQDIAPAFVSPGYPVCHWVSDDQQNNGSQKGYTKGTQQNFQVEGIHKAGIIFPCKYPVDAAVKASLKETVNGHQNQGQKKKDPDPENAWEKNAKGPCICMPVEKF